MRIGIHKLLRSQAHQHRIVVRRVCGQDQGVGERAAVFRQQRAELLRAHRLNDFRRQIDLAVPIGGNQQLGLIALGVARHQQGGAHVALGGYAVAVGAGDVPALAVQRVIHAVYPADGVQALPRNISVGGGELIGALLRLGAVDMQGLNDLAVLLHLHVQPGERQVAGVAHGKNQVDVIPGAHAGVVGHSGLQFSRHHQLIGELGQGLAQVGAVLVAQIHRVEALARILQLDAGRAFAELHQRKGIADGIGIRVVAHTAHQIFLFVFIIGVGTSLRGRALRPVQIDAAAELDGVEAIRVDLDVVIGHGHGFFRALGRQRDTLQPVDEPALIRLHPVQIEQGILVVDAVDAGHHFEIDDVALGQLLPIAIANAGEHAVRAQNAQNIEVHLIFFLIFFRRACGNSRRLAHVVTGDLLPVFKEVGFQRSATEIRCLIISADD